MINWNQIICFKSKLFVDKSN